MKKFYSLLAAICFVTYASATTFTFSSDLSLNQTVDGITLAIAKGAGSSAPKYYDSNGMRLYAQNTITISGTNITSVVITFAKQGSKPYANLTASDGNLVGGGESTSADDEKQDVWTGSASTVTFTLGATGQRLIKQIVVNGEGGTTPPVDDEPTTPTDSTTTPTLDPSYVYGEPTTVIAPNQTVQGEAYSFVSNNIAVSASRGAIAQANGENITTTYFSAHATHTLTFTATQPIKALTINGFVKAGFTATTDKGQITYITPMDDTEANPVLSITDINANSVTITCAKQLRCYSVDLYFVANPENTGSTNKTIDFVATEVEYEYFASYSTETMYNYSLYLYQSTNNYPKVELDIYTPQEEQFAGTYTFAAGNLGEYCYYDVSDEEYYALVQGSLTITQNGNNYNITGSLIDEKGVSYNISYSGELKKYDSFKDETTPAQTINVACNWIDVEDYIAEYGDVYFYMGDDNYQITLDVFIDYIDYNTILPVGTYPINSSNSLGTILASEGMGYTGALPSNMLAIGYDQETDEYYATDVWYIVSGQLQVSQTTNGVRYELNATTKYGSTINAVYEGQVQSINQVTTFDKNAPMYDVLGHPVGEGYKGIVIQNGKKFFVR